LYKVFVGSYFGFDPLSNRSIGYLVEMGFVYSIFSLDLLKKNWYNQHPFGAVVFEPDRKSKRPGKKVKKRT
jgi:hypothetical protein